jgi:hypothetical protein
MHSFLVDLPAAGTCGDDQQKNEHWNNGETGLAGARLTAGPIYTRRILLGYNARIGSDFPSRFQIICDGFFFIQSQILGICADKPFVEDSARKQFKMLFFQSAKQSRSDFRRVGNIVERHAAHFALPTKPLAK